MLVPKLLKQARCEQQRTGEKLKSWGLEKEEEEVKSVLTDTDG